MSLLPDCFAVHLTGSLEEQEAAEPYLTHTLRRAGCRQHRRCLPIPLHFDPTTWLNDDLGPRSPYP